VDRYLCCPVVKKLKGRFGIPCWILIYLVELGEPSIHQPTSAKGTLINQPIWTPMINHIVIYAYHHQPTINPKVSYG
jgi:hypothetical protein